MARKYAIRSQENFHFVTFTVLHWIDVFIREGYREIFLDSVRYCQDKKGLEVGAWCIMTNHIHMILRTKEPFRLEDTIRDLKSYTSRHIRKAIENNSEESRKDWILWMMKKEGKKKSNTKDFQFWEHHNHPVELDTNEMIDQRLGYIHQNPVKAGFVNQPEDWIYSSAGDYAGKKGLLELLFLD